MKETVVISAMSSPTSDPNPSADLAAELAQIVDEFDALQSEYTYEQARGVLQTMRDRLHLTPREATDLEQEVLRLSSLLKKLDQGVVQIAVFGLVGRGKSSLLNALVGNAAFATGPTHGVTQKVQTTRWQVDAVDGDSATVRKVAIAGVGNSCVELIDTPGLDEIAGEERDRLARQVAREADLILFVVSGDITRVEYDALVQLRSASKPMLLVFNKVDQYPDADRQNIYAALQDQRLRDLISPDEIVMTAAAPLTVVAQPHTDGRRTVVRQRGQPQIEELKLKILSVLEREGFAIVALNTMLYADELNENIVQKKLSIRSKAADEVIWNSVMTKAIAVALNPITIVDILTGAIVDVAMIVTLSRLYGLPMTQAGAIQLLRSIALELGSLSVSELVVTLGLSSLKGVLTASAPATGGLSLAPYTSVALTQAAVAGVATYGVGAVTKHYFVSGATWGPEGPKAAVAQILETLDEESILSRIKAELADKIKTPLGSG